MVYASVTRVQITVFPNNHQRYLPPILPHIIVSSTPHPGPVGTYIFTFDCYCAIINAHSAFDGDRRRVGTKGACLY